MQIPPPVDGPRPSASQAPGSEAAAAQAGPPSGDTPLFGTVLASALGDAAGAEALAADVLASLVTTGVNAAVAEAASPLEVAESQAAEEGEADATGDRAESPVADVLAGAADGMPAALQGLTQADAAAVVPLADGAGGAAGGGETAGGVVADGRGVPAGKGALLAAAVRVRPAPAAPGAPPASAAPSDGLAAEAAPQPVEPSDEQVAAVAGASVVHEREAAAPPAAAPALEGHTPAAARALGVVERAKLPALDPHAVLGEKRASSHEPRPAAPPAHDGASERGANDLGASPAPAPAHQAAASEPPREPVGSPDVDRLIRLSQLARPPLPRDTGEMRLEVSTGDLGRVEVRVAVRADAVHANLVAGHDQARETLSANRGLLEEALGRSNLRLEGFTVDLGRRQHTTDEQGGGRYAGALAAAIEHVPSVFGLDPVAGNQGLSLRA